MARLFFIRHGQTDYNLEGIVQGSGVDADLNEKGRKQGLRFFLHYRGQEFDKVYCTELKRTRQTIQEFETLGHPVTVCPELNELGWGKIEGAIIDEEVKAEFAKVIDQWNSGKLDACIEGGESPNQVWARAQIGIQRILNEIGPQGTALICIHGRIMRIILSQILGYGMHQMNLFPHQNTALNILEQLPNGRWKADRLNDLRHLL